MVFRPVDVPSGDGVLDDTEITVGRPDTADGYNQFLRRTYLSAPFRVPQHPELRRYYIAKYDVTENQYDALSGSCTPATRAGQKPRTGVSWDEAVTYASKLTAWLLAHQASALTIDGRPGFLRLPVDDEWSYAARGGMRVKPSEFTAPLWPMPDGGPEAYIAAGPDIGEMQAVGQMKPNPLGLYDMLGNAGQMMLDPYQLNRVGRLQGQIGGLLVRGGDFHSNPEDLTTNIRVEWPPYNAKTAQPTRDAAIGFRLVIGADALGSLKDTQKAQNEFDALVHKVTEAPGDTQAALAALKEQSQSDPATLAKLARIENAMAADSRARLDAEKKTFGAQIQALIALGNDIWEVNHAIETIRKTRATLGTLTPTQTQQIEKHLADRQKELDATTESYLGLLEAASSSPAVGDARSLIAVQRDALHARGEDYLFGMLALAQKNLEALHGGKIVSARDIQADVAKIPSQ
nr:SUMF1/EgtB/PvdO family nonheme iron enzyme [Gluconacetobacter takamatsuzukensis]